MVRLKEIRALLLLVADAHEIALRSLRAAVQRWSLTGKQARPGAAPSAREKVLDFPPSLLCKSSLCFVCYGVMPEPGIWSSL